MRSSIRLNPLYTDCSRAIRALRLHVRTFRQFWLLCQMLAWSICLRMIRPLLSVQRLVWLAIPAYSKDYVHSVNVLTYMQWLDSIGILVRTHNCLVRALVCHRFLTLSGMKSSVLIGFDGRKGHSWVEVNGEAVLEKQGILDRYRPLLTIYPGSRKLVKIYGFQKNC